MICRELRIFAQDGREERHVPAIHGLRAAGKKLMGRSISCHLRKKVIAADGRTQNGPIGIHQSRYRNRPTRKTYALILHR